MSGVICNFHSVLHVPSFSAFSRSKLRNPVSSFNEVADGDSVFLSRRGNHNLAVSSTRAEGNDVPGRASKGEWRKNPQSSESEKKSANKEEILAVFKRIQSSISKGEAANSRKRNSKTAEDVLNQSTGKGKRVTKQGHKPLASRKAVQKKEQKAEDTSEKDFKPSRPPSNFTRRSPVPSPSSPRDKVDLKSEVPPSMEVETETLSKKFEGMKLAELKEMAKSKGIRGYSKLKKSELVELLIRS